MVVCGLGILIKERVSAGAYYLISARALILTKSLIS
jgi:hypothetical protein